MKCDLTLNKTPVHPASRTSVSSERAANHNQPSVDWSSMCSLVSCPVKRLSWWWVRSICPQYHYSGKSVPDAGNSPGQADAVEGLLHCWRSAPFSLQTKDIRALNPTHDRNWTYPAVSPQVVSVSERVDDWFFLFQYRIDSNHWRTPSLSFSAADSIFSLDSHEILKWNNHDQTGPMTHPAMNVLRWMSKAAWRYFCISFSKDSGW